MRNLHPEPLTRAIDRLRQRHLSFEEITAVPLHAATMGQGCDVLEKLRSIEPACIAQALGEMGPEASSAAHLLSTMLRQSAFAMATHDEAILGEVMEKLVDEVAALGIQPAVLEKGVEAARSKARAQLGARLGNAFNAWLDAPARFLVSACEVMAALPAAASASAAAVGGPEGNQRHLARVADRWARLALAGILSDGQRRIAVGMKSQWHELARQGWLRPVAIPFVDALAARLGAALDPARSVEFLHHWKPLTNFLVLAADATMRAHAISSEALKAAASLHPDSATAFDKTEGIREQDVQEALRLACLGAVAPGEEPMVEGLADMDGMMKRGNPGVAIAADLYLGLVEQARLALSSRSLVIVEHVLHRAAHYLVISADIAQKHDAMLAEIPEALASKYPQYFSRHATDKPYITRDHEQLLFNLALGILPSGWKWTGGRFQVFGEFLASAGFNLQMMLDSFEALEAALGKHLHERSATYLMPRWKAARRYLEFCCRLSAHEEEIIATTAKAICESWSADVRKYPEGVAKVSRDLRAMLHTVALAMMPEGDLILTRGLHQFLSNLLVSGMSGEMLAAAYKGLAKAVGAKLGRPHGDFVVSTIERITAFLGIAVKVAPVLEESCARAAAAIVLEDKALAGRVPNIEQRLADDLRHLVELSVLATLPTRPHPLARELRAHVALLRGIGASPAVLEGVHARLRKDIAKALDRGANALLLPVLEAVAACSVAAADLSAHGPRIVADAVAALYSRHPDVESRYPACREKTTHDFDQVLRHLPLALAPAGDEQFLSLARTLAIVSLRSAFPPAFMADAYNALIEQVGKHCSKSTAKAVAPAANGLRDMLAIAGALGGGGDEVVRASHQRLAQKHPHLGNGASARAWARVDQAMMLEAALLRALPGGEQGHKHAAALLAATASHSPSARPVLKDAGAILGEECARRAPGAPSRAIVAALRELAESIP